jgi:hypothetical protein
MSPTDNHQKVRVTLDDLSQATKQEAVLVAAAPKREKNYGNINTIVEAPLLAQEKGSILLQGWFYLGLAGFLGALAAWVIAEPGFTDGGGRRWGNIWMTPLLVMLMCVGFAVAESIVERSAKKSLIRAGLSLLLGFFLGFAFNWIANIFYTIGLAISFQAGIQSYHNPVVWIVRGLAWMVFGVAGGVVYGIIGRSLKKTGYGALGGAIGAALGGVIFDPISFATHGGAPSRAIGFCLLGLSTGIAIGLVESALKDRWLYVTSGPLAGKQFILYKPQTTIGSSQTCDIYLFKDSEILPHHATLQFKGSRLHLLASGPVYLAGHLIRGPRVLDNGATLQLGRYGFRYQEKQRR